MKYNIRKNWIDAFEALLKKPVIFTPFVIIGLLECLALELAYFSVRFPLAVVFAPIIKKFFGETFLHYPANLTILSKLFYSAQTGIYIFAGTLLTAVAVQVFVNIRTGHPVIIKAIVNSAAKKYVTFACYGVIYIVLMTVLERGEGFVLLKGSRYISRHFFSISPVIYSTLAVSALFFTFVIVQAFLVLTIPIIIVEKKPLFRAIIGSIAMGARNFIKIFCLIAVPYLFYLPVIMTDTFLNTIMDKTFPEISFYITLLNIVTAVFVDSFVIVSVTQFLLATKKTK